MRRALVLLLLVACGRGDPGEHLGAVSAELSTVNVTPSVRLPTDGGSSFAVTVTVRDHQGAPVAGRPVELVVAGVIRQPELTDIAGQASATVASRDGGDYTLVVIVDPGPDQVILADTPTLRFGQLMLAYGFDADLGASVVDLSGHGYDAIASAAWTADGRHGAALEFDGIDAELDIGYVPHTFFGIFEEHEAITVEAWVRPRVLDRPQTIYQLGGEINSATLGLSDTGRAWFVLRNDPAAPIQLQSPAPLTADAWVHLAGVKSRSETRLYVDGVEVAQRDGEFTWSTGSDGQRVGSSGGCSGLLGVCGTDGVHYAGTIDDLRVWDFGRSATDVLTDMQRPAP